jgi:transcriptional regulator with XRE-family HTH domain
MPVIFRFSAGYRLSPHGTVPLSTCILIALQRGVAIKGRAMTNMIEPNGSKIRELRKEKRLLQKQLGHKVGLSERTLREVENRNKSIPEFKLVELAQKLGVELDVIKTPRKLEAVIIPLQSAKDNPYQLQLRPVIDGGTLWEMARRSEKLSWAMEVDPTTETAPWMEEILKIVSRLAKGSQNGRVRYSDEYDEQYQFPDIYRRARIREIIDKLSFSGIQVVANTYVHRFKDDEDRLQHEGILYVSFASFEDNYIMKWIDPGLPDDIPASIYDFSDDLPF